MLLQISTTHQPASDLGYLLHKHPGRVHRIELTCGQATVFYPTVEEGHCVAALVMEVDPVRLVRSDDSHFDQYVNDRPYAASSFLSLAIVECFGTAMNGRSRERQELADSAIPLEATIPVLPAAGGEAFVRGLFEPLGYEVEVQAPEIDPEFPEWGAAPYVRLTLRGTLRLRDLLSHLYVLVPVLDARKHYYVNRDEVEKLLGRGGEWLARHPLRDAIVRRYLLRDRLLISEALGRLAEAETLEEAPTDEIEDAPEPKAERGPTLHEQRLHAVEAALLASGARRVLDLGCGEGKLIRMLLRHSQFERIVGMDVSWRAIERAHRQLKIDRMPDRKAARVELLHGSLVYRDARLEGFDAAALVEVIEHLDPWRLDALERVVFESSRPRTVLVTTPNREYNARYEKLREELRHSDHRFEWTRAEFEAWARAVAGRHGYEVTLEGIGTADEELGAPSQLATFRRV
jgi:3' terminal RNA ribose 2'-O-methyltransferase Hen1